MSINLLDLAKDQITSQLSSQASKFLGESESSISSALGHIMPALLGSAVQKASSPTGAQGLFDLIGGLDSSLLNNVDGVFSGGASNVNSLLNSGGGIVDMLLGNKIGAVIDMIGKASGLKSGSTSSLLKLAAPFLMNMIGKQISGKGLDYFTELLMDQKANIASALPTGLGGLLGLVSVSPSRASSSSYSSNDKGGDSNNMLKWLLPLLLLTGLGWWLTKDGCAKKEEMTATVDSMAANMDTLVQNVTDMLPTISIDSITGVVTYELGANGDLDLPGGVKLTGVAQNGFENSLLKFITSGTIDTVDKMNNWFTLHDVQFISEKTDYATDKAMAQIKNVGAILKAYPNVILKIGGYTDVSGDKAANQKLSQRRADRVKKDLIASGASAKQIKEAVGYGSKFAAAGIEDREGMARDRKTAAKVASK